MLASNLVGDNFASLLEDLLPSLLLLERPEPLESNIPPLVMISWCCFDCCVVLHFDFLETGKAPAHRNGRFAHVVFQKLTRNCGPSFATSHVQTSTTQDCLGGRTGSPRPKLFEIIDLHRPLIASQHQALPCNGGKCVLITFKSTQIYHRCTGELSFANLLTCFRLARNGRFDRVNLPCAPAIPDRC